MISKKLAIMILAAVLITTLINIVATSFVVNLISTTSKVCNDTVSQKINSDLLSQGYTMWNLTYENHTVRFMLVPINISEVK